MHSSIREGAKGRGSPKKKRVQRRRESKEEGSPKKKGVQRKMEFKKSLQLVGFR
jgi:hypothetical protein